MLNPSHVKLPRATCPECEEDIEHLDYKEFKPREGTYNGQFLNKLMRKHNDDKKNQKNCSFKCPHCKKELCNSEKEADKFLSQLTELQRAIRDKIYKKNQIDVSEIPSIMKDTGQRDKMRNKLMEKAKNEM